MVFELDIAFIEKSELAKLRHFTLSLIDQKLNLLCFGWHFKVYLMCRGVSTTARPDKSRLPLDLTSRLPLEVTDLDYRSQ